MSSSFTDKTLTWFELACTCNIETAIKDAIGEVFPIVVTLTVEDEDGKKQPIVVER